MDVLHQSILILSLGLFIITAILLKSRLKAIGVPANIGFIALGFLVRFADSRFGFLNEEIETVFIILMRLGVIALLFEVGLESNLHGLLAQLRKAVFIGISGVLISGFTGFAVSYWLLGEGLVPSLFVGSALTATSVGFAVSVWKSSGKLNSPRGRLLVDIAELDDISGIVLMALVIGVAPVLKEAGKGSIAGVALKTVAIEIGKLIAFGGFCFLFSKYVEKPFTSFFKRLTHGPDPMIVMVGTTFIIASVAGFIGFSVAIGAFFAGLIFSRDPKAVRMEASFDTLYDFFVPFFFIGIGLSMEVSTISVGLLAGALLLLPAIGGKLLAIGGPAWAIDGKKSALLLGVSMIPRAEIAIIVMERGKSLGAWAVPPSLFSGVVVVSLVTTLIIPFVLRRLLGNNR
jgi:Kef-type K+ transport system membrane component KefB